jgi:hypothetical protein
MSGDPTDDNTWGALLYLTKLKANEDVICFLAGFDANDGGACKTWNAKNALQCRADLREVRKNSATRKHRLPIP